MVVLLIPAFGQSDNLPIVVVRVDDCMASWTYPHTSLDGKSPLRYARDSKIPITWGIIVDYANDGRGIPWQDIKDYLNYAGGEPASHSYHHTDCSSPEQAAQEIASSKQAIEQHLPGYSCTSFIEPGAWVGDACLDSFSKLDNPLGRAIRSVYNQSMAYVVSGIGYGNTYYRHGICSQIGFDNRYTTWTSSTIISTLNSIANSPGQVFIFQIHNVGEGHDPAIVISELVFKAFIDKLVELRSAQKIRIFSFSDVYGNTIGSANPEQKINLVPDADFEGGSPLSQNPFGLWISQGRTAVASAGGVDNSKYIELPDSNSALRTCGLALAPGRYEFSWYQKPEAGTTDSAGLTLNLTVEETGVKTYEVDSKRYTNTSAGQWERKSALLKVPDKIPTARAVFWPGSDNGYKIDNVSLVQAPLDPSVSPTQFTAIPNGSECDLSWDTPTNAEVSSVCIRSSTSTYPVTPSDEQALTVVPAQPGTHQQIAIPITWPQASTIYFSAFAMKANGNFSPPDIAKIAIDRTPPVISAISVMVQSTGTALVRWNCADPESGIIQCRYAVGSCSGGTDIIPWTTTTDSQEALTGLPTAKMFCVSVQAENQFGAVTTAASNMISAGGIEAAERQHDGAHVSISGSISAIFNDCYYLEDINRTRAIRVNGRPSGNEGDIITLTGAISTTASGEREILPD